MGGPHKKHGTNWIILMVVGWAFSSCHGLGFVSKDRGMSGPRVKKSRSALRTQDGTSDVSTSNEITIMAPNYVFDYCLDVLDKHVGLSKDSAGIADASDFKKSFPNTYSTSKYTDETIKSIRKKLSEIEGEGWVVEIQVIGGNWCSDTREGIPVLARVLDNVNFLMGSEKEKLVYLRVDRSKKFIDTSSMEVRNFIADNPDLVVTRVPWVRVMIHRGINYKMINLDGAGQVSTVSNNLKKLDTRFLGEIVEVAYPSWEAELLRVLNNY